MKKYLTARQRRNRDLAQRDRANRCGYCHIALIAKRVLVVGLPGACCSDGCAEAYRDLTPRAGAE